jgi:aspartyl-tRNA(Asn)/glutamyl-tRNA(Gln) amidotransferase subunit C
LKIEEIAMLARLELSEEEKKLFSGQLESIIQYIDKLNELDTTSVEPTAHVLPIKNVFRKDEPAPSLPKEKALQNAPDASESFYRVPKIIE